MAEVYSNRAVPPALDDAWQLALGHADPLIALAAAHAVRAHLGNWEAKLVAEAIASGVTWEMVGEAMGVSRQAAWERFRARAADSTKRGGSHSTYEAEIRRLQSEVKRLKREAGDTRRLVRDPSRAK